MRAAVLEEFGKPLRVKQVDIPGVGPRDVLVRVRYCGVCGTDLKIKAGKSGPAPLPMRMMPHEVVRNELEVVGSRANTTQELRETMDLVAQGRIRPIVDQHLPLEEIEDALRMLAEGRFLGRAVISI